MPNDFDDRAFRWFMRAAAVFYSLGAAVHAVNLATGFGAAPAKWLALDAVYLAADLGVVAGVLLRSRLAAPLLALTALSQIALYTAGRAWLLDVPEAYRAPDGAAHLDGLVAFHAVTLVVLLALVLRRRGRSPRAG